MSVGEVLNAIGLAGSLMYFLTPILLVIIAAGAVRRLKFKQSIQRKKLKTQEENAEKLKGADELNHAEDVLNPEITDYRKYSSLHLEFGEDGRVREEKSKSEH